MATLVHGLRKLRKEFTKRRFKTFAVEKSFTFSTKDFIAVPPDFRVDTASTVLVRLRRKNRWHGVVEIRPLFGERDIVSLRRRIPPLCYKGLVVRRIKRPLKTRGEPVAIKVLMSVEGYRRFVRAFPLPQASRSGDPRTLPYPEGSVPHGTIPFNVSVHRYTTRRSSFRGARY